MQSAEVPEMSLVPRNYLLLYCWDGHYDLASFTFSVRFISWIPKATLLPQKLLLPSTMQMLGAEAHISIYNARKPRQEDIGIAWPDRSAWTDSTRFTEGPSFKKENNVKSLRTIADQTFVHYMHTTNTHTHTLPQIYSHTSYTRTIISQS